MESGGGDSREGVGRIFAGFKGKWSKKQARRSGPGGGLFLVFVEALVQLCHKQGGFLLGRDLSLFLVGGNFFQFLFTLGGQCPGGDGLFGFFDGFRDFNQLIGV